MSWGELIQESLEKIREDPQNDYLVVHLNSLFEGGIRIDDEAIKEIEKIDDPAVRATISHLKWVRQGKTDFPLMSDCFSQLDRAVDRYLKLRSWVTIFLLQNAYFQKERTSPRPVLKRGLVKQGRPSRRHRWFRVPRAKANNRVLRGKPRVSSQ